MGLPLSKMSLADFMVWESRQPIRHEFFRGDVFATTDGSARHNRVILNLAALSQHLDGTPCQVFAESMKVRLAAEAVPYPDVLVTCGKAQAGDEQIVADPRLIIEVLSPSSKGCDKRNKFILYRGLAALREYALIDPATREVEVFTLKAEGWLLPDQTRAAELVLASIDCHLPMTAVFKGVEVVQPGVDGPAPRTPTRTEHPKGIDPGPGPRAGRRDSRCGRSAQLRRRQCPGWKAPHRI